MTAAGLNKQRKTAKRKGFAALGRYRFETFAHWAAIWACLNRLCSIEDPNPFTALVMLAREEEARCAAEPEEPAPASNLDRPITDFLLTARSRHCLEAANLRTIRDLTLRTGPELLRRPHFGRKSLAELQELLASMGLGFQMRPGITSATLPATSYGQSAAKPSVRMSPRRAAARSGG